MGIYTFIIIGMINKQCVVSFANSKGKYIQNLSRLGESLSNFTNPNFDGDFLGFIGEASCGAQPHEIVPYGFKIHAIQRAIDAGYKQILWLDSSCFAIKNLQPIFDKITETGFAFQDAGHWLGEWANDHTLQYFWINRDGAMEMRMIGNAGLLGLNFDNPDARVFFDKWRQSMVAGCFTGAWSNNEHTESQDERCRGARHDMSASSAIVHNMGLFHLAYGGEEVLQYAGIYDEVLNDTIILKAQG